VKELERALRDLAREVAVPETPDLAPGVLARLERRPRARAPRRRWALALAVALAVALGAVLAIPEARSALFRVLSIGGERIVLVDELPEVEPAPGELDLAFVLGREVSLGEARAAAGFPLRELDEEPDGVYVGDRGTVWFLYGTPADVRLLVAQTPGVGVGDAFFLKKLAAAGTSVEEVEVRGRRALLLSGDPHVVVLLDENGAIIQETARLARNVLVWEEDGVAIRLEGAFSREEALELAASLR
jgi:hypothetical protein